jgi:hypothetical protein
VATPTQTPVLVYERIAANRRRTWLLLSGFGLALLPVLLYGAEYMALWFMLFAAATGLRVAFPPSQAPA